VAAKEIKTSELQLTHGAELIQQIADLDTREWGASEVDSESEDTVTKYKQCIYTASDTFMNMHSGLAARLSAGGLLALAKEVVQGTLQNGFSVMRPPVRVYVLVYVCVCGYL
jgi:acetoin utilization deacetylase AcuC-like enzyme